jgi:hypothetical protein
MRSLSISWASAECIAELGNVLDLGAELGAELMADDLGELMLEVQRGDLALALDLLATEASGHVVMLILATALDLGAELGGDIFEVMPWARVELTTWAPSS